MGGGARVKYPSWVWYLNPPYQQFNKVRNPVRNTLLFIPVFGAWVWWVAREANESTRFTPHPYIPFFGASWLPHHLEDDPEYDRKVTAWNKHMPSLLERIWPDPRDDDDHHH